MKPLLTIGIPTYNRPTHLIDRTKDLEKLGYLNHPDVQIIIHDNDSKEKEHCRRIKRLQKTVKNLSLIESSPNIGMVKGCYKILANSKGDWIMLLGDDDPILMKCSNLLNLIKKNKECDHLYFSPKINENSKQTAIKWVPKLKVGNYEPSFICAKQGFTTGFAFLGSHCFRNKQKMAEIWLKSHRKCLFYGHCVMFIENYKKSSVTGRTVAAWTSGNERITHEQNLLRHLEIANLLKTSRSDKIKDFIRLKPLEVVKQGVFPLVLHLNHHQIGPFNRLSGLQGGKSIKLKKISLLNLNSDAGIHIFPTKIKKPSTNCIVFRERPCKYSDGISLDFQCGPKADTFNILKIIALLGLKGPLYLKNKKITFSQLYLAAAGFDEHSRAKTSLLLLFSAVCFGPEEFDTEKILRNALSRPRIGLYKILLEIEKRPRIALKRLLGEKLYYKVKQILFGREHFSRLPSLPQAYPLIHQ